MRREFGLAFAVLAVSSLAMMAWQPGRGKAGVTPLVWTSDDNPLRKEQVALFNRLHPGLDLQLDPNNEGIEKVIVQSLAGVGPDLLDCRDANQLSAYVKSGIAWDVTGRLQAMGVDVRRQAWPNLRSMEEFEGKVYGVPTNIAPNAIWVNKEAFDAAGIPVPAGRLTWSQFIPLAQKLTRRDKDGRPVQFGFLIDWWNFDHFRATFGGHVFSQGGTRCTLSSSQVVAAVQFMHDLVYKYHVSSTPAEESGMESAGGWGSGTINIFGAKRAAMALGGRWWLANMRGFKGLRLTVIESPFAASPSCSFASRVTLINAKSPRREQALQFLAYLASRPYNELVNAEADGLAAFPAFCQGDSFLHNPTHPEEDYNAVWRDTCRDAVPSETSPFVNGQIVDKAIARQLDLVKADSKTAEAAMRDAEDEVNAAIAKAVRDDPELRARWVATEAKG